MLVLSKRLHSIYVLRCFNDCFAMTGLFSAIYMYQKRQWTWGSLLFSCGLGVKMNLLLVLPTIGLILIQAIGPYQAVFQFSNMVQVQVCLRLTTRSLNKCLLTPTDSHCSSLPPQQRS